MKLAYSCQLPLVGFSTSREISITVFQQHFFKNSDYFEIMKQAILITAYKDVQQLLELVQFFPEGQFSVYIHFDRKSTVDFREVEALVPDRVQLLSRKYKVNWGGRNHLLAILHLAEEAMKDQENTFFHLITGQDFPIQPVSYFTEQLDLSNNYLQHVPYPVSYLTNGARDWFELFHLYDLVNGKQYAKWNKRLLNLQRKLGVRRSTDGYFTQLYYGSTYWSLTRATLESVIDFTKSHPAFLRRMRATFCAEELYIPSVMMNSVHSGSVVNDNLRYIDWGTFKSGSPRTLDLSDADAVLKSGKLFARKFESGLSDLLREKIIQRIESRSYSDRV